MSFGISSERDGGEFQSEKCAQSKSVSQQSRQSTVLVVDLLFLLPSMCLSRTDVVTIYGHFLSLSLSKDLELSLVVKIVISRDISVTLQCLVYFPPTRLPGDNQ